MRWPPEFDYIGCRKLNITFIHGAPQPLIHLNSIFFYAIAGLKLKNILLVSIQVDLTDEDAIEFQEDLLKAVQRNEASGVLIDITALDVVDSFLARVLNETVVMVKLLGTEAVLSGMQPDVALTLVEMGRELIGVSTAINLDHGMEKLQDLISKRAGGV